MHPFEGSHLLKVYQTVHRTLQDGVVKGLAVRDQSGRLRRVASLTMIAKS